ncbi:MAG TPA: hypothetical protein VLZ84_01530 [Asticcacaulis sp.]|nr:hypothetical protein [Asticcacaulis sp.]
MQIDQATFAMLFTWIITLGGAVVWAVRQEGRINLANERIDGLKDKLTTAIDGLMKFNETSSEQVEAYRSHTDRKIDELGKSMSAKFDKVFDKLDKKADKP